MRVRVAGLLWALLPALPGFAAEGEPVVRAEPADAPLRIDGHLDEEAWSRATARTLDRAEQIHPSYRDAWEGPSDLSGRLRVLVTRDALVLGVEVVDDRVLHEAGAPWWVGDALEVFLDTDRTPGEPDDRYTDDDLQLFLLPFHPDLRWGVVARGPERPFPDGGLRGIVVASTRRPDGYVVEARIPLSNLRPLVPDDDGCIGFDLALDDVDETGADKTGSYLTLSGRFDLYRLPRNFARLDLSGRPSSAAAEEAGEGFPWGFVTALVTLLVLLGWLSRHLARTLAGRGPRRSAILAGAVAGTAAVVAFASPLADRLDAGARRQAGEEALDALDTVARAWAAVDRGGIGRLGELLTEGRLAVDPPHDYDCVPLTPAARAGPADARAPGPQDYGIPLAPGDRRTFALRGATCAGRLRLDLSVPRPGEREDGGLPAAEVEVETIGGRTAVGVAARTGPGFVLVEDETLRDAPLASLTVRSLLPWRPLGIDALYAEQTDGSWRALPLATPSEAGIPLDVWHDRPPSHVVRIPPGDSRAFPLDGRRADRLWLAVGVQGAYPRTPWGAEAATVRAVYTDGTEGPALALVNGRDLLQGQLTYAPGSIERERIAQRWESGLRFPVLTTLHGLELDGERELDRLVVEDGGVVEALRVFAVTLGRRTVEPPEPGAPVTLRGGRLELRPEAARAWHGLPIVLRAAPGASLTLGQPAGVPVRRTVTLPDESPLAIEVFLPRGTLASALRRWRMVLFGTGVFLLACAVILAGESLLQRARRLQAKVLAALGTATVLPLAFLLATLAGTLQQRAENELEEMVRTDLRAMQARVEGARVRARELATSARDTLEIVLPAGETAVGHLLERTREEIASRGAFLRVPDLEGDEPSPLGNTAFVDAVDRSGLYHSPWDGLLALGVARTGLQRRYLVGLPAPAVLGPPPHPEIGIALHGPDGRLLAASGPVPPTADDALDAARLARLEQAGGTLYEARVGGIGGDWAGAWSRVRDGERVVGTLGVYRSRRAVARTRAQVLQTLFFTAAGAVLLVVLAGVLLVERVSRRLGRLTTAAHALAGGDLAQRVPVESVDEVGRLASSFNQMADALDTRVRQLTALHRGAQELTAAGDREDVAAIAAELLRQATGTRHVLVAALERATDRLETLAQKGEGAPLGVRLPESGPARRSAARQEVVASAGSLYVPLLAGGRTVGLAVCSPLPDADDVDRDHMAALGRQIGIALENARLYHVAVTDELTGLYSLAFFTRRMREEVDRAAATGRPLSLLRVVIDDFRATARRVGAATASQLLVETATTIERTLPRRNMIARRDAGEILALLVESDARAAREQLDRVGEALQRTAFPSLGNESRPTFTFRSVTYPQDGEAADILLDALFESTESWDETDSGLPALLTVPDHLGVLLGRGAAMRHTLEVVSRIAPTNATILLTGETGSGKEVLADLVQANSDRRSEPWIKVNCAAIPENLLESELFGHERGAFTGADKRRIGRFEEAHRGTLFLDEIGDLPLPMQVKLLRVLQERKVRRIGGNDPIRVDVRILAATNRDLADAVRRGAFREDLYHRLNVIEIRVPPLRERRDEIPRLCEHFRREVNRRHRLAVRAFSPDAHDALYRHPWPGNIRQLKNVIERAMLLADAALVEARHLDLPAVDDGPGEGGGGAPVQVEGLTPRQERILAAARETGGISNSDVVAREEVSARTALRELQRLVERGLLVRVGRRRGAVYRPA